MKNSISIVALLFIFSWSSNAQPAQQKKQSAHKILKKLTKELDLTIGQQREVKPLLENEIKARKKHFEERKRMRESGKRPSKEGRKQMMHEKAKNEKEITAKMKNILSEDQFARFLALKKEEREKRMQKRKTNNKFYNKNK